MHSHLQHSTALPAWPGGAEPEERRTGYSFDDLVRYEVHTAAAPLPDTGWYRMPVERMQRALAPAAPPAEAEAGAEPGTEPATRTAAEWSTTAGAFPLRGSFRDFRAALRLHLTGISPEVLAEADLPQPILLAKVGAVAAEAYRRGDIGAGELAYHVRAPEGIGAYRLGEALLEELGYYRRPGRRAGATAGEPFAGGHFTGLRGIWSLDDLMPPERQERLLLEALAWHLRRVAAELPAHLSLAGLLGLPLPEPALPAPALPEPAPRQDGALPAPPGAGWISLSGILAAAHLHGAVAVAAALSRPSDRPRDRRVRATMRQFAGYATPFEAPSHVSDRDVDRLMQRVRKAVALLSLH